jgi:hypothetical protein
MALALLEQSPQRFYSMSASGDSDCGNVQGEM